MIARWFLLARGALWLLGGLAVMVLFFCLKIVLGIIDKALEFVQHRVDAAFNYLYGDF